MLSSASFHHLSPIITISILVSHSKPSTRRPFLHMADAPYVTQLRFVHRNFSFVFVIADISTALLGTDFLNTFDLKVDVCQSCLKDHTTGLCIQGRLSACSPLDLCICHPPSGPGFANLLNHYPQLLHSSSSSSEVRHNIVHHIHTSGLPVFACPHHLGPQKTCYCKKAKFEHMLQLGIIQPVRKQLGHTSSYGPKIHAW